VHDPNHPPPTPYLPIAQYSFGWVDGVCVTACDFLNHGAEIYPTPSWHPLSILARAGSDNPWVVLEDIHELKLYTLQPNPLYTPEEPSSRQENIPPYVFPPRLHHQVPGTRGRLSRKQVILGRFGTAMWIQPAIDRFYLRHGNGDPTSRSPLH